MAQDPREAEFLRQYREAVAQADEAGDAGAAVEDRVQSMHISQAMALQSGGLEAAVSSALAVELPVSSLQVLDMLQGSPHSH
eukprot:Skav202913  [mRNA]  locus=scaffold1565:74435:75166:+ [translate_table: standard]